MRSPHRLNLNVGAVLCSFAMFLLVGCGDSSSVGQGATISVEPSADGSNLTITGSGCGVWEEAEAEWLVYVRTYDISEGGLSDFEAQSTPVGEFHMLANFTGVGFDGEFEETAAVDSAGDWSVDVPVSIAEFPVRTLAECYTTDEPLGGYMYESFGLT